MEQTSNYQPNKHTEGFFDKKFAKPLLGAGAGAVVLIATLALAATGIIAPASATSVTNPNGPYRLDVVGSLAPHMGRNIALILDGEDPEEVAKDSANSKDDAKADKKAKDAKDKATSEEAKSADANNTSEHNPSLLDVIEDGRAAGDGEASGAIEDAGEFVSDGEGGYVWQSHNGGSGDTTMSYSGESGAATNSGGGSGGGSAAPGGSSGGSGWSGESGGGSSGGNSGGGGSAAPVHEPRWVVDRPAWTEQVLVSEGHYETIDVQKVICGGTDHNPGDPNYCGESPIWDDVSGWEQHQAAFLAEMRKTDPYYQCTGRHRPAKYITVQEQVWVAQPEYQEVSHPEEGHWE